MKRLLWAALAVTAFACSKKEAPAPEAVKPSPTAPAAKERKPAEAAGEQAAAVPKDDYDLAKLTLDDASYPEFKGKKLGIVFTSNVIGEVEPCG